ncbi:hypothetical protein C8A03DRAFT_17120 [Achaetomium macrosporum]|uniref:Uncharacterized protein n=1 Tax=Achaetomium macrosporum TaxID=79813 RepID=A0AAN7C8A8_9PEZI|nr:hypothetical protein C8A03DRAFT_17120 [Achaetomium macrosporum]
MNQTYKERLRDAQLQVHLTTVKPPNKRAILGVVETTSKGLENNQGEENEAGSAECQIILTPRTGWIAQRGTRRWITNFFPAQATGGFGTDPGRDSLTSGGQTAPNQHHSKKSCSLIKMYMKLGVA